MLTAEKIKAKLTTEQIIKLCCELQNSEEHFFDAQGNPIFNTCLDHSDGDSWKLVYYPTTKLFHCYTRGESYDIFELVSRARQCDFKTSFDFIVQYFHFRNRGFNTDETPEDLISDWDIFQKVQDYNIKEDPIKEEDPPVVQENMLEFFYPLAAPIEWEKEGISAEVMYHYGIRIDSALQKVIIPQRNIEGQLVGIRGRSFNPLEIDAGKKYMPVFIEGQCYNTPTSKTLFGIYENKKAIQRIRKVLIVEAEKSVLQLATMYGIDQCWAVGVYGSNFSETLLKILLDLDVTEIIIAFDKEYSKNGIQGDPDVMAYEEKILKTISPVLPYVNVSVILDFQGLLEQKDSPTDRGKEIFEQLYHSRIKLYTYEQQLKRKGGKGYGGTK